MRVFGPNIPEKEQTFEETGLFIAASPIRLVLAKKISSLSLIFVLQGIEWNSTRYFSVDSFGGCVDDESSKGMNLEGQIRTMGVWECPKPCHTPQSEPKYHSGGTHFPGSAFTFDGQPQQPSPGISSEVSKHHPDPDFTQFKILKKALKTLGRRKRYCILWHFTLKWHKSAKKGARKRWLSHQGWWF